MPRTSLTEKTLAETAPDPTPIADERAGTPPSEAAPSAGAPVFTGWPNPQGITPDPLRYTREGREMKTIDIRGKAAYDAKTLRNEGHKRGLVRVETVLKHLDLERRYAAVEATVYFRDGTSFSEYGDASPESVPNPNITPHFLRMATTRAISRALALGLNADANSADEYGSDLHDGAAANYGSGPAGPRARPSYRSRAGNTQGADSSPATAADEWS